MSTLITGSSGYLGIAVVERALEHGARRIRCLVRAGSSRTALLALQARFGRGSLEIVEGNLTRRHDVNRALIGVRRVVHLAASLRGAPADIFCNTVVGSQRLYDGVAASPVERLVVVSTLTVYGLADIPPTRPVRESTRLDPHPERRDAYTHSKIRQEQLLETLRSPSHPSCVVLRPGPLYGRGRTELPSRVGLQLPGLLLHLGGDAPLPLSFVDNCAEAVRLAAFDDRVPPGAYNVVDDDVPRVSEYLSRFRRAVRPLRVLRLPYACTELLAHCNEASHSATRGQVPLVLTPYRTRNMWRGHSYDTTRLRFAGWRQPVPTATALDIAFGSARVRNAGGRAIPTLVRA